ncbi:general secretion pathway protein K [Xylella taiwanensis]|nr:type II secretion system protein GspK [Xylella taiwanensis]EWS77063.1 general secretion pathway protein K [Xylella taiwanensis]
MRARGAALIVVLWLVALLTAMIGVFALSARIEHLQGSVLVSGAQAQEVARAGLEYAVSRLQGSNPTQVPWILDGRSYDWRYADATLQMRMSDESGKVDLNVADLQLLTALIRALGVDVERAARLAGAIIDWRDTDHLVSPGGAEDPDYAAAGLPYGAKDSPFESIGELRLVLGMDTDLYRRMLPNVTIYSGNLKPDVRCAPAPVLTALGQDVGAVLAQRQQFFASDASKQKGSGTYSIESKVRLAQGRGAMLRAVVRMGSARIPGMTYTILRWEEGVALQ